MSEIIKESDIEVFGTEWKEFEKQTGRYEVLNIEYKGEEQEIWISNIDQIDINKIWDADWVYTYMNIVAVEFYDEEEGETIMLEYEENYDGELKIARGYKEEVEAPGKEAIASNIIWSRD